MCNSPLATYTINQARNEYCNLRRIYFLNTTHPPAISVCTEMSQHCANLTATDTSARRGTKFQQENVMRENRGSAREGHKHSCPVDYNAVSITYMYISRPLLNL
jgi:hypothetical protein